VAVVTASANAQSPADIHRPWADTTGVLRAFGKQISEESKGRALLDPEISESGTPSKLASPQRQWRERLTRIAGDVDGITLLPPLPAVMTLLERLCIDDYLRSHGTVYAIRSLAIVGDSARLGYSTFRILSRADSGSFAWGGTDAWFVVRRMPYDFFIPMRKTNEWRVVERGVELYQDGFLNERQPPGYIGRSPSKPEDCIGAK